LKRRNRGKKSSKELGKMAEPVTNVILTFILYLIRYSSEFVGFLHTWLPSAGLHAGLLHRDNSRKREREREREKEEAKSDPSAWRRA
jgi:hypothetical protein